MTDFSRNQLTSATKLKSNQVDRWVIPNDRQLSLRARLGTGWSVRTNISSSPSATGTQYTPLSPEELHHIRSVVHRASCMENQEQQRISVLVNQYQCLESSCKRNNSKESCYVCSTKFPALNWKSRSCHNCKREVCLNCVIEIRKMKKNKLIICNLCNERRELWKKSSAWYFGDIPFRIENTSSPFSSQTGPIPDPPPSSQPLDIPGHEPSSDADGSYQGQQRDIKIVRCKPDSAEHDSDSDTDAESVGSTGTASYSGSLRRFKRVEADTVSSDSQPIKDKSVDSFAAPTNEESATESLQDLRLMSFQPEGSSGRSSPALNKRRGVVSFHPDTVSQKSDGFEMTVRSNPFNEGIPRCVSIPNADLKDIEYYEEVDTDSPYGSLIFTLFYQEVEELLEIEVLGAQHLPDIGSACNPYVSINLAPSIGNSRTQRTHAETNTFTPKWKQKISYFALPVDELLFKSLVFTVLSERMLGSDDVIAGYRMELRQLQSYELTHFHVYMEQSATLATDEVAGEDNGKIQLSIQYDSTSTLLYIKVVRCAALHIPGIGRVADPYVKLYLLPDSSKSSKKKTLVKKNTLNPEFHEEFVYKVPLDTLLSMSLEISVWDHNMTRNAFLGGVYLSSSSTVASEKMQWSLISEQPNKWHNSWHCLRDILNK